MTASGPESPWSDLALTARPQLVSVARRVVRDRDEAEDVVDEAIARLASQIDRGEAIETVVGWLHRTVLRISVDRARASRVARRAIDSGRARMLQVRTAPYLVRSPAPWRGQDRVSACGAVDGVHVGGRSRRIA